VGQTSSLRKIIRGAPWIWMRILTLVISVLLLVLQAFGQQKADQIENGADKRCLIFAGFAGAVFPQFDLANDYGTYGEIGGSIFYQSRTKWIMGLEGGYLFGGGVKKDPVPNLRDFNGNIIGNNGSYAVFKVFQRAFLLPMVKIGKTIPLRKNPKLNTLGGLTAIGGFGWLQHWTFIQDQSKKTPQFSKEYIDGYDRLTGGLGAGLWLGYIFLPVKSKLNFHLEAGYFLARTEVKRFDFAQNLPAGQKRLDGIIQLRFKICFTIRSKSQDEYYFY
jgi:hypothetical protein